MELRSGTLCLTRVRAISKRSERANKPGSVKLVRKAFGMMSRQGEESLWTEPRLARQRSTWIGEVTMFKRAAARDEGGRTLTYRPDGLTGERSPPPHSTRRSASWGRAYGKGYRNICRAGPPCTEDYHHGRLGCIDRLAGRTRYGSRTRVCNQAGSVNRLLLNVRPAGYTHIISPT